MTFNGVWADAAFIVPTIAAQARTPILSVDRIVDPPASFVTRLTEV